MALQQHFGNAGCAAEVAVNLERRMGTEEIGVGAGMMTACAVDSGLQQILQQQISVVAVTEPRPKANLPSPRPARSLVAATEQGLAASLH